MFDREYNVETLACIVIHQYSDSRDTNTQIQRQQYQ